MITDKITDIIEMLIRTTKSGDLIWTQVSKNDYDSERRFKSKSEDESTEFELNIKFTFNNEGGSWMIEKEPSIWIRNQSLPGGSYLASGFHYKNIKDLRDIVRSKFCPEMSPSTEVFESRLDDILKGISKSNYRDGLLGKIFGGK